MIDYLQVQRLALKNNVSPEIIEKDYFIELILFYFSKDNFLDEKFVFRGGTALKKVYFPEYRFSEDLDFVIDSKKEIKIYQEIIIEILQKISSKCEVIVNPVPVAIGDSYGGGIVAYILQSGDDGYDLNVQHGLIAAAVDQSDGTAWSNIDNTEIGTTAQGIVIGTGQANTDAIIGQAGHTASAAKLCKDYAGGGMTDWFLPSKDELNQLYAQKAVVSGFADDYYWSSSEDDDNSARGQSFSSGGQGDYPKDYDFRVRAVRAF